MCMYSIYIYIYTYIYIYIAIYYLGVYICMYIFKWNFGFITLAKVNIVTTFAGII